MNKFMQRYYELEKELPLIITPEKRQVKLFIMDYCLKESEKLESCTYVVLKSKMKR